MDPQQFIFVLGSIDGKLGALQKDVTEIKDHLRTLNGKTARNTTDIAALKSQVKGLLWAGSVFVTVGLAHSTHRDHLVHAIVITRSRAS